MGRAGGLVLIVLAASYAAGSAALAVYALSFWHYLLYWWATNLQLYRRTANLGSSERHYIRMH